MSINRLPPLFTASMLALSIVWCDRLGLADEPLRGAAAMTVPDGFVVEPIAGPEQVSYGMCATLDPRGRLFVCESSGKNVPGAERVQHPECRIRMLEDRDGDGRFETGKLFADKLSLPMGALWHLDALYVASPPDFLRFRDTDDDGVADERDVLLTGWDVKNTASLHGPYLGPDGWLYLTHGRHGYKITTREGETIEGLASRIYRCRPDGTGLERIAGGGFDNPVELAFSPAGEIFCTMTYYVNPRQGLNPAGMRDGLLHVVEGGVYPKDHECVKELQHTGDFLPPMSKFPRVAPCGLLRYRGVNFGPEYQGNLFSAQFNPHSVQRHVVTRVGSTFSAVDSDFLTSTDPDFHPADIIEDADGSLIVVDTGGWYLQACPLSRIARYELRGGIYRVRRKDVAPVSDPRGKQINLAKLAPRELTTHLDDSRPAVRDRAVEALVQTGNDAVGSLVEVRNTSASSRARRNAVWALSRIASTDAWNAVRDALSDADPDVRQAAVRALGLGRVEEAVDQLSRIARDDVPAVRRQAATALGQLGSASALDALFASARSGVDRFLDHAVTYAVLQIAEGPRITKAITDEHPAVQRAALLALEQIDGAYLEKSMLSPLLGVDDPALRRAVLWVAGRHPGWSSEIVGALGLWLTAPTMSDPQHAAIQGALITLSHEADIQALIAEVLTASTTPDDRLSLLLEVMGQTSLKTFPATWTLALRKCLAHASPEIRHQTVATIRARNSSAFDHQLTQLAQDASQPMPLRLSALGAVIARRSTLPADVFRLLQSQLDENAPALQRVAAAEALGRAKLEPEQLVTLAERLPTAGPLVLPTLLRVFEHCDRTDVGHALVSAFDQIEDPPAETVRRLIGNFPQSVRDVAQPVLARLGTDDDQRAERMSAFMPLMTGGNPFAGRAVFMGNKAACSTCHRVGDEGELVGPDLSKIGAVRAGRDLLESVLYPSSTFAQGYETFLIATTDGAVHEGVIVRQSSEAVTLRTAARALIRLDTDSVDEMRRATVSIMPRGLENTLTKTELRDLLAYLQSLK